MVEYWNIAALTTSGLATFVLARYLTGNTWAAALGGLLFAFAPYRWAHVPHLQLRLALRLPLDLPLETSGERL